MTYRYSVCALCWLCWHTLNSALTASRVQNVFKFQYTYWQHCIVKMIQVSVGNTNLTIIIIILLRFVPGYRTEDHTKLERAAGCQLQSVWMCSCSVPPLTAQRVLWKDGNSDVSKAVFLSVFRQRISHVYSVPVNTKPDHTPRRPANGVKVDLRSIPHIGTDIQINVRVCAERSGQSAELRKARGLNRTTYWETSSFVYWNYLYQVLYTISCNFISVPKHAALQQLWSEIFVHAFAERRSHRARDCRDGKWHV